MIIDPDDNGARYNAACTYALLGEFDRAIDLLHDWVKDAGPEQKNWFMHDADLDLIRDHSRYPDTVKGGRADRSDSQSQLDGRYKRAADVVGRLPSCRDYALSMERRLSAILAADVVGYSRLMGCNEVGTLTALNGRRAEVIEPRIAEHGGRVVKLTGDGLLAEFPSVVNAVECATSIQREMRARNVDVPEDRRIELRIGINLGDVIAEGDDIFGDGVNVAARIESVGRPGGVAVSAAVRDHIGNKLDVGFEDTGEHLLKNIDQPVRIYRGGLGSADWLGGGGGRRLVGRRQAVDRGAAVHQYERRSRAGVFLRRHYRRYHHRPVEDFGIVRRRTKHQLHLQGQVGPAAAASQANLGVKFLLEGSVRKAGERVRVTGQLIDGPTGGHVWADRYDRDLTDIFAIQDEITQDDRRAVEGSAAAGGKRSDLPGADARMSRPTPIISRAASFSTTRPDGSFGLARQMFVKAMETRSDLRPSLCRHRQLRCASDWLVRRN